jgi:hypothetical protein
MKASRDRIDIAVQGLSELIAYDEGMFEREGHAQVAAE